MALTQRAVRAYAYSKIQLEDPEEAEHRRAQFLIYKILEKADRMSSRKSWCRSVRVFKLKIKIGKRLKRLRKGFSSSSSFILPKPHHFLNHIACLLKSCKYLVADAKTGGQ